MNFVSKSKTKCFWSGQSFGLIMVLSVVLLLLLGKAGLAVGNESVEHYKMISTVEYTGKGQFKNQVETLLTVRRRSLMDDKVWYSLSTDDFDLVGDNLGIDEQSVSRELSFVIDKKTGYLSGGENLMLWEKINN